MIFDQIKRLASEFSTLQKAVVGLLTIMALGAAVGGWLQWAKDAPIIVGGNVAHLTGHHDSIAALFEATSEQIEVIHDVESHLQRDSLANAERDRKLDYLVCLRLERRRELDSLPKARDCDSELLEGR